MQVQIEKLVGIQEALAPKVILKDKLFKLRTIGGCDQAFKGKEIISAMVVCDHPTMEVVERKSKVVRETFPYVPGLLMWREGPAMLEAWLELDRKPDVLLVNGLGINHPRFLGNASHLGLILNACTIGVTQSLLCGEYEEPLRVGEARPIFHQGIHVGYALKSKQGCKPIFVSPGHKLSLETSLKIVKESLRGYKFPEPLRLAHLYANELKRLSRVNP
jgi:deoxyribonuclease V